MKKMRTSLFFAAFLIPFVALTQGFKPVQINPFGMLKSDTISLQAFAMADMTKDGLPDLLYTDEVAFNTFMVINQGTVGQPDFSTSPVLNFEESTYGEGAFILFDSRMVDFDQDGDFDHMYSYYTDDPNFTAPYAVELNQPELVPEEDFDFFFWEETELTAYGIPNIPVYTYETSDYRDVTGDGLPDILASRIEENTLLQEFVFYKRLSSDSFALPVIYPFGLTETNGSYGQPCLIDLDSDGDQDLLFLDADSGNWLMYKNEGSAETPVFAMPVINPLNLSPAPDVGATAFVIDINQDGKDDLMASNFKNFYYYEFDAEVSAADLYNASNVRVFPSLIYDKCQVVVTEEGRIEKIAVQNVDARTVSIITGKQEIDFAALIPGMYYVTVYLQNGSKYCQKVVKVLR